MTPDPELVAEIRLLHKLLAEATKRANVLMERERAEQIAEGLLIDKLTAASLRTQTLLKRLTGRRPGAGTK
jgi:hypothetical protein